MNFDYKLIIKYLNFYRIEMSKFNYVFKPLSIDTYEYSYMDGKTEKSFTIKRKTSLREGKSVM